MKLLIADDDRVLTHPLAVRLRAKGCEITVAHDAMQVLMAAMRMQPDAIVLDHQMPAVPVSRRSASSSCRRSHPISPCS